MPAFLTSRSPWAHVATSQGTRRMLIFLTLPSDQSCPTAAYYSPTEAIRQAQGDNRRSPAKITSKDCHFGIQHLNIHTHPSTISPKMTQVNLHWVSDPQYPNTLLPSVSPESYNDAFSPRTLSVSLLGITCPMGSVSGVSCSPALCVSTCAYVWTLRSRLSRTR